MSLQGHLNDGLFLYRDGRHEGALTLILCAVSAASTIRYPDGTPSLNTKKPATAKAGKVQAMGDGERFELYLDERLAAFTGHSAWKPGNKPFAIAIDGVTLSLSRILYKYYRCGLVHEAKVKPGYELVVTGDNSLGFDNRTRPHKALVGVTAILNCLVSDQRLGLRVQPG